MKILGITREEKVLRYTQDKTLLDKFDISYISQDASDEEVIAAGKDAEVLIVDAIQKVSPAVINGMKNLKLIHSEGVAFNSIDIEAAAANNVYVCNCKGMNAKAVAEQSIMLMLGVIKGGATGDAAVRAGKQIDVKMSYMVNGNLKELSECVVGLVGFGDIAKETALLLKAFGSKVYYTATHRHEDEEAAYGVEYLPLDELLAVSDMVSLHVPVTEATTHMANEAFFNKMKEGAYLINTSRGELVDNAAMIASLENGHLAGAGLDTIETEPVKLDNPLINLAPELAGKLYFSPHIGGITARSFARGYAMIWDNIVALSNGQRPKNIVNGL